MEQVEVNQGNKGRPEAAINNPWREWTIVKFNRKELLSLHFIFREKKIMLCEIENKDINIECSNMILPEVYDAIRFFREWQKEMEALKNN